MHLSRKQADVTVSGVRISPLPPGVVMKYPEDLIRFTTEELDVIVDAFYDYDLYKDLISTSKEHSGLVRTYSSDVFFVREAQKELKIRKDGRVA